MTFSVLQGGTHIVRTAGDEPGPLAVGDRDRFVLLSLTHLSGRFVGSGDHDRSRVPTGPPQPRIEALRGPGQVEAVGAGIADGDIDGQDRSRRVEPEPLGGEGLTVVSQGRCGALGIDEPGKGVADAQPRCQVRSVRTGPQEPGLRDLRNGGHQRVAGEGVILGEGLVQPGQVSRTCCW